MISKFHVVAAVGLLLAVLALLACPVVELPEIALRSQQASLMLLLTIALCAHYPFMRTWVAPVRQTFTHYLACSASVSGPSSLTGVLLC